MNKNPYFQQTAESLWMIHSVEGTWSLKDYHCHDSYEVFVAMSGGYNFFVNGSVFSVERGDVFLFNSADIHKVVKPQGFVYDRYVLMFLPEFIQKYSTDEVDLVDCFTNRPKGFSYKFHINEEQLSELVALYEKALSIKDREFYGRDIYLKNIVSEILLLTNLLYSNANTVRPTADNDYKRIKPIITYINNNIAEELTLEALASMFYISRYHLGFLFKKVTGMTPNEYIISRRIVTAKELLKQNDTTISIVGELVGYHNTPHFIRTFKKIVGISPKQFALKATN